MKRIYKLYPNPGFTLVELLIVVAIISLLMTIGISVYNSATVSARDSKRKADVDAIAKNLETNYDVANRTYKCLSASSFTGGSIPADPNTTPYPISSADLTSGSGTCTNPTSYKVCSLLDAGQDSGINCLTDTSTNCYCKTSSINAYQ